jgi:hypothetical protein
MHAREGSGKSVRTHARGHARGGAGRNDFPTHISLPQQWLEHSHPFRSQAWLALRLVGGGENKGGRVGSPMFSDGWLKSSDHHLSISLFFSWGKIGGDFFFLFFFLRKR